VVGQADDGERLLRGVARVSFDVDAPQPREETEMVSTAQMVPEDVLLVDDAERVCRLLEAVRKSNVRVNKPSARTPSTLALRRGGQNSK
jgi:hypothetical protein